MFEIWEVYSVDVQDFCFIFFLTALNEQLPHLRTARGTLIIALVSKEYLKTQLESKSGIIIEDWATGWNYKQQKTLTNVLFSIKNYFGALKTIN